MIAGGNGEIIGVGHRWVFSVPVSTLCLLVKTSKVLLIYCEREREKLRRVVPLIDASIG